MPCCSYLALTKVGAALIASGLSLLLSAVNMLKGNNNRSFL